MANQRGKNQKLVAFPLDQELLDLMDRRRGRSSRSQFIRDALAVYLGRMGIMVGEALIAPPDRAGKKRGFDLSSSLAEDPGPSTASPLPQKPVKYTAKKARRKKT